jgi:hypothetical protein
MGYSCLTSKDGIVFNCWVVECGTALMGFQRVQVNGWFVSFHFIHFTLVPVVEFQESYLIPTLRSSINSQVTR